MVKRGTTDRARSACALRRASPSGPAHAGGRGRAPADGLVFEPDPDRDDGAVHRPRRLDRRRPAALGGVLRHPVEREPQAQDQHRPGRHPAQPGDRLDGGAVVRVQLEHRRRDRPGGQPGGHRRRADPQEGGARLRRPARRRTSPDERRPARATSSATSPTTASRARPTRPT